MTLLPVLKACDNFSLDSTKETLVPICLSSESDTPLGYLFPDVLGLLQSYNEHVPPTGPQPFVITAEKVSIATHIDTFDLRSALFKDLCEKWRHAGHFAGVIGGRLWRDELYAIYAHPFRGIVKTSAVFAMERVCCALFGFVTYGVHMTIYTPDMRIWVPRRSKTKQTYAQTALR